MLLRRFKLTLTFLYIYIYMRLNLNTFRFIIILIIIIFWIGINNENNTWTHFKFENLILVSYFKKINAIIHILTITWDSHHPFFYHFLILCDIRFFYIFDMICHILFLLLMSTFSIVFLSLYLFDIYFLFEPFIFTLISMQSWVYLH